MILRSRSVVLPDGVRAATVHVQSGRIARISGYDDTAGGGAMLDAGDLVVSPGIVDTHVHVNEPGRTEWEGFDHATRAAAAGGVTTLVDMPLNSVPPTTTVAGLHAKREAAGGRCYVDVGFWGGVVPGNEAELAPLAQAGVLGFKCFLAPSGVDEFEHVGPAELRNASAILARVGRPLLVHAELPAALLPIDERADPRCHAAWLASRPPHSEHAAIDLVIAAAATAGARAHIVHLSAAEALPSIRKAKHDGVALTVETCPHYLVFAAEEIADGSTPHKCAPPIRSRANRDRLWRGLLEGDIDLIASDHSPSPPALKRLDDGDFVRAWGGIASLQLGLAAVWSTGASRGVDYSLLARWMSSSPAALAGLDRRKGAIAVGLDADFVIWDPEREFVVDGGALYHRHPVTPYSGHRLRGRVVRTIVRGDVVFDGTIVGPPRGALLASTW